MIKIREIKLGNVFTLFLGNSGAQLITFVSAIILARLYTPEEFGVLGVFLSISQILIPISCLGYEAAIVITSCVKDAAKMCLFCLLINIIFSSALYIPLFIYQEEICVLINTNDIYPWIYFLPLSVFFGGCFNALNYFNTKIKQYDEIAKSNIIKSLTCAAIQMLGSLFKLGSGALIFGQALMNMFGNIKLAINLIKKCKISDIKCGVFILARRYKKFPLFYSWGVLLNTLSLNVTNIFIKRLFSASDVGFYSYSYKYIGFPISMISTAVGQVYFQELSDAKQEEKRRVFHLTFLKLLLIGLPIFTLLYFVIEQLFVIAFGDNWRVAGEIARILIPLFFVRFIVSPLSMTLIVLEKQFLVLLWQIGLFIVTCIPYYLSYLSEGSIFQYVDSLTIYLSTYYCLYLVIIYSILCNKK